jgi:hypothetical protein
MTKKIFSVILMSTLFGFSQKPGFENLKEIRQNQIENIGNPELWDMERMKKDVVSPNNNVPMTFGAYPVPRYDVLGPYKGGGSMGNAQARSLDEYKLMVDDKEVVFNSFFIGDSPFYKDNNKNRIFFTIITVVDSVDTNNFVPGASLFSSRNHPDYGGEGSIITKNNRVDYVAFTTPEKGSFAIVNMRLFHLEFGDVIVVAPQKDGTLRSLQLKGEEVSQEQAFDYIKNNVLKKEEVLKLLTDEGVI